MKCDFCGAEIGLDDLKCAYCGADNMEAIARQEKLSKLVRSNEQLEEKVRTENKLKIFAGIYWRITVAMAILAVLSIAGSFTAFYIKNNRPISSNNARTRMIEYYEAGDLENLYYCMCQYDLFSSDTNYVRSYAAIFWKAYANCKRYYAMANEQYVEKGAYDKYDIGRCIDYGVQVLGGNLSYVYPNNTSGRNQELMKAYQDEVRTLFTKVFHIPEELLEEPDERAITRYVEEVLPIEK